MRIAIQTLCDKTPPINWSVLFSSALITFLIQVKYVMRWRKTVITVPMWRKLTFNLHFNRNLLKRLESFRRLNLAYCSILIALVRAVLLYLTQAVYSSTVGSINRQSIRKDYRGKRMMIACCNLICLD